MVYLEGVHNVFCNTIVFPVSLAQTNYLVVGAILLKIIESRHIFQSGEQSAWTSRDDVPSEETGNILFERYG